MLNYDTYGYIMLGWEHGSYHRGATPEEVERLEFLCKERDIPTRRR